MFEQMIGFFVSAFRFPGLTWSLIILAIAVGFLFGAIWLISYWPPLIKRPWFWAVGIISALLTWSAIAFIQVPLQAWPGRLCCIFGTR